MTLLFIYCLIAFRLASARIEGLYILIVNTDCKRKEILCRN